ncbi:MAG: flagellar hook capping FlgD N-terminal domain-containing protein, partial [Clostridium sp.]|nr:flagellar hook capping FlgD N-terminal domain-containing protein [Clostridium sp.]
MAIQTTLTNNYTKAADAKASSKSSYESGKIGTTDRGTAIVEQNSGLGKNAFLNLLVAQLKNMDPTQDQDSTAYVTQMAQFASIEQTNNLNTTMKDFAYEQMVGKVAILSDKDVDGYNKYGIISQIVKNGTTTTATILDPKTGTYSDYAMSKIIGTSDSGYGSANYETALNSNFSSASALANDKAIGVYVEVKTDKANEVVDGQNTTVTTTTKTAYKCRIEKAYLDKQNSLVKVTIQYLDDNGENVGDPKTVDYSTIAVAGKDLSDDVIKESIKNNTT